jgi:hypothetical protein
MSILDKIKSVLISVGQIENLIKEWKPKGCETEKDFKESLFNYLEKKLEGIEIIKESGKERVRVDLAVANKIFIELKKDLKNTGQLQRLLGQLELYSKKLDNIIVVICGEVDKNLLKQLMDKKKAYDWDIGFDCRILQK